MSLFSAYLKTQTLDLITNDASRYIALFTTAPSSVDGTGGIEVSAGWYARVNLTAASWSDDPPTPGGAIYRRSTDAYSYAPITGSDVTVVAWGIYDAASGGNLLAFGPVAAPDGSSVADFFVGQTITFDVGGIVIVIGGETGTISVSVPGDEVLILTSIKVANYTANTGERVRYDANFAPFTIEAPPSPVVGDKFGILEVGDSSGSVTIDGNGNNIVAPSTSVVASFVITTPNAGLTWVWNGTNWGQI